MIYWLIPYLVAYNASDAGDWKYGPEHVFKVEFRESQTTENLVTSHGSLEMYLACRPMNSSFIQCRIETSILSRWKVEEDGTRSVVEPLEIGNDVFQVEFKENGVSELWFMNTEEGPINSVLSEIFATVHWGIDMSGKKYGRYERVENSVIGSCETTFDIGMSTSLNEEIKVEKSIVGYSFDIPQFEGRSRNEDEPIVIEKNRNTDRCSEKTIYWMLGNVTSSRSRIYLGKNSFSTYTRNIITSASASSGANEVRSFLNIDEYIHLRLETIRPAKKDIGHTGESAGCEAGSATGTRWPEEDTSSYI